MVYQPAIDCSYPLELQNRANRIAKTQPIRRRAEYELRQAVIGAFALGVMGGLSLKDGDEAAAAIISFVESFD